MIDPIILAVGLGYLLGLFLIGFSVLISMVFVSADRELSVMMPERLAIPKKVDARKVMTACAVAGISIFLVCFVVMMWTTLAPIIKYVPCNTDAPPIPNCAADVDFGAWWYPIGAVGLFIALISAPISFVLGGLKA